MALLGLTLGSAFVPMGAFNTAVNLAIATAKALLVAIFFMHLRHASGLNRVASTLGLLWLALLLVLTVADFLAR
jgi:cytochrome c oxidase subunit 4